MDPSEGKLRAQMEVSKTEKLSLLPPLSLPVLEMKGMPGVCLIERIESNCQTRQGFVP